MLEDLTVISWDRVVAVIPCFFDGYLILPGLTTFTPDPSKLLFLSFIFST